MPLKQEIKLSQYAENDNFPNSRSMAMGRRKKLTSIQTVGLSNFL